MIKKPRVEVSEDLLTLLGRLSTLPIAVQAALAFNKLNEEPVHI